MLVAVTDILDKLSMWQAIVAVGIGFVAGALGGMLGVGGSVIVIPGLTIVLGPAQHLYQALAMVVNVIVSVPAARRHYQHHAMTPDALRWMLPAAVVFVIIGVWMSNLAVFSGADGELLLRRLLAAFLVYVIVVNVRKLWHESRPHALAETQPDRISRFAATGVGAAMGSFAGLLGIGGGAVSVPLQQVFLKLPLRSCIANSSAVICISASLGAVYKNATLGQHGESWQVSLVMAALLAPTAYYGGRFGAKMTHRLPIRQVRLAFIVLMVIGAWRMAGL